MIIFSFFILARGELESTSISVFSLRRYVDKLSIMYISYYFLVFATLNHCQILVNHRKFFSEVYSKNRQSFKNLIKTILYG